MEENTISLQELMPLALRINGRWVDNDACWRVRNDYNRDGSVAFNRTDKIQLGGGRTTNLRTLIEAMFVANVGEWKYKPEATFFTNSRNESVSVFDYVVRFLTNPDNNPSLKWSLMLYGTPGTGKTCLMQSIQRTLVKLYENETSNSKPKIIYVKASALGEMLKDEKERYKEYRNATVLFIDDLGFGGEEEMVNDYGSKRYPIEEIIEHRYDKRLMTICTSNMTKPEFEKHYGIKIFSRFCEMFAFVPMNGIDLRKV